MAKTENKKSASPSANGDTFEVAGKTYELVIKSPFIYEDVVYTAEELLADADLQKALVEIGFGHIKELVK